MAHGLEHEMAAPLLAYCVKCKAKREMRDAQPVFLGDGRPATQGTCSVCGTRLTRLGRTAAHDSTPTPALPLSGGGSPHGPKLVIVESPAKARTVGKFLGRDYRVKASIGHIRDLPANRLGVDVEHDFKPRYVIPEKKKDVVHALREEAKQASEFYLATDPDREGEAISWHLKETLARDIAGKPVHRVEFHEITRDAVDHAFAHPRAIDLDRVDAQQARRILDRLVGYKLSPLLRDKVGRKGLSAGRVQSVAVRLVVEREREIQAFVPVEYWSIVAELAKRDPSGLQGPKGLQSFRAKLIKINGQDADLKNRDDTLEIVAELEKAAYVVTRVAKSERRRNPAPPFTTSTLQQEASKRLGFAAKRTMAVAQSLYEGVDVGDGGRVGLITYMRTDSTAIAPAAQAEAREFIQDKFGASFLPPAPPVYRTKTKGAQEAHEAIRPTSAKREPAALKSYLDRDQYRLYDLIWKRFIASQMAPAILDVTSVDVTAAVGQGAALPYNRYLFRATGSIIKFPGFLAVYEEAREEGEAPSEDEEGKGVRLPPLSVNEPLDLLKLIPEQHFTQPPPRYTEASLVKALEEYGIGRPSTYAPILTTIQMRGYVAKNGKQLFPTELGFITNDLLVGSFEQYVDVGFTAQMEEQLDEVAEGKVKWVGMLREFYSPFIASVEHAQVAMPHVEVKPEPTGQTCPECGGALVVKLGRFGKFIACSNYPKCRHTEPIIVKTGAKCPQCGKDLIERRTKKGRVFYGCTGYKADDPNSCQFTTWKKPLAQPCPKCGGLLVEAGKNKARCLKCGEQVSLVVA
jgi:DNA topoisomerase-1